MGWIGAMLTGVLLLAIAGPPVRTAPDSAWVPTGLTGPVREVVSLVNGTLLARTDAQLLRSEDGGASWRSVAVPGSAGAVAVDPLDPATAYAAGTEGLYKSTDDGATWASVLPTAETVQAVAASPADPALVYLALTRAPTNSSDFRFLRSRDGGVTWEQLEEFHNSLCGWGVRILQPHPTDASRVFRTANCYAGRILSARLPRRRHAGAARASERAARGTVV